MIRHRFIYILLVLLMLTGCSTSSGRLPADPTAPPSAPLVATLTPAPTGFPGRVVSICEPHGFRVFEVVDGYGVGPITAVADKTCIGHTS